MYLLIWNQFCPKFSLRWKNNLNECYIIYNQSKYGSKHFKKCDLLEKSGQIYNFLPYYISKSLEILKTSFGTGKIIILRDLYLNLKTFFQTIVLFTVKPQKLSVCYFLSRKLNQNFKGKIE